MYLPAVYSFNHICRVSPHPLLLFYSSQAFPLINFLYAASRFGLCYEEVLNWFNDSKKVVPQQPKKHTPAAERHAPTDEKLLPSAWMRDQSSAGCIGPAPRPPHEGTSLMGHPSGQTEIFSELCCSLSVYPSPSPSVFAHGSDPYCQGRPLPTPAVMSPRSFTGISSNKPLAFLVPLCCLLHKGSEKKWTPFDKKIKIT